MISDADKERYVRAFLHWRTHPVDFVKDVHGATPDPWQAEALNALATGLGKVSIRSCHGPGKSAVAAWSVFWHTYCFYPTRCLLTAPAAPQIETVLLPEMELWRANMPEDLRNLTTLNADGLSWTETPMNSFARVRTAREDKPEALAGLHGKNVLLVIDEASGVGEKVYEVLQGALTAPQNRLLMISNPTAISGTFWASHNTLRHRYHCIHVSAEDSPRVSQDYVDTMRDTYGETSNAYRVRVLGEFPESGDELVVPLELIEAAQSRVVGPTDVEEVWGLDCARFGADSSALAKRKGNTMHEHIQIWSGLDLMALCGRVVTAYDALPTEDKPVRIYVDVIGIGAGVVDRLRELGLPVVGVNVAEAPTDRTRFLRLRDQLYWSIREWLDRRACYIAPDDELVADLRSLSYTILSSGKIQVISKDELKRKGMRSPDRADALALTFAHRDRAADKPIGRGYLRKDDVTLQSGGLDWVA